MTIIIIISIVIITIITIVITIAITTIAITIIYVVDLNLQPDHCQHTGGRAGGLEAFRSLVFGWFTGELQRNGASIHHLL